MTWVSLPILLILISSSGLGQVKQRRTELNRLVAPNTRLAEPQQKEASLVFQTVQEALESSDAGTVSEQFDRTVHLSLPGIEQGQFSRDQASQLLSSYLRSSKTLSIEVKKKEDSLTSPYLSAVLRLQNDDREQQVSLYVSLVRSGSVWKIGHFSLY